MRAHEDHQRSRKDMSQLLGIARKIVVAVERLERRHAEVDSPIDTSKPEQILPPPLLPAQFSHVL